MAIFKKLIVSGSNAHLNHVSASIFSGSFTGNGSGLTNLLSASYALTASYIDNIAKYFSTFEKPIADVTWSFQHNLSNRFPVITVWDSNYEVMIPEKIYSPSINQTLIYFPTSQSGFAAATAGSILPTGSNGNFSGSFSGSFFGNGSGLTNVISASYALTASYLLGGAADGNGIYSGNGIVENTIVDVTGSLLMKNTGSSANTYFSINKYWDNVSDAFIESTSGAVSYGYITSDSSSIIINVSEDNGGLDIDSSNRSTGLRFLQRFNLGNYYETFQSSSTTLWTIEKDSDTGLRYYDEKPIKIGMTYAGEYSDIQLSDRSIPDVGLIRNYLTASYALTSSFTKPMIISPSEFGSDQHNYNPTGFKNSSFVRISGTDKIYSITGFSSDGIESGMSKKLANVGTSSICLVGLHPSSSAANQISTGYNFIVAPKTFVEILYDGDLQKWLINGQSKQPDIYYEWAADFDQSTGLPVGAQFVTIPSGQIAEISSSNSLNLPDGLLIDTLSSTTGGGLIILPGYSRIKKGQSIGNTFVSSILNIDILSDGTNRFVTSLAIGSGAVGAPYHDENNTIGIRYSDNINSGKWQFYAINNSGTTTTVDTGITVNSRQMYNLRIELDEIGENAYSYIDGIMTGMITGINLLPVTGSDMFPRMEHVKTAGTDSRKTSVHSMKVGIYTK